MNKLKKIMIIFLLPIVAFLLYLNTKSDDKATLVLGYESFYQDDKSTENLYKLCRELYGFTDYEKILEYYPLYLQDGVAYNFIFQSSKNEFLAKQHVEYFELDYCFTHLHVSDFEEYKSCLKTLKKSLLDINSLYYYLAAEIETREYSDEQLQVLLQSLKELENNSRKIDERSLLSNLSLQAYIYDLLNEERLYLDTIKQIEKIEENQSGEEPIRGRFYD